MNKKELTYWLKGISEASLEKGLTEVNIFEIKRKIDSFLENEDSAKITTNSQENISNKQEEYEEVDPTQRKNLQNVRRLINDVDVNYVRKLKTCKNFDEVFEEGHKYSNKIAEEMKKNPQDVRLDFITKDNSWKQRLDRVILEYPEYKFLSKVSDEYVIKNLFYETELGAAELRMKQKIYEDVLEETRLERLSYPIKTVTK